jgi:hypothetical protein
MKPLIEVFNAMFKNRKEWVNITDEEKTTYLFIFNRYLSKIYIGKGLLLNSKQSNKPFCMDLWFHFMKNEPYPKTFWSKSEKEKSLYTDKEVVTLMTKLDIKREDLDILLEYYPDFIKEELKYYKDLEKK